MWKHRGLSQSAFTAMFCTSNKGAIARQYCQQTKSNQKNTDMEKHTTHMNNMGWCNLSWGGPPPWSHGAGPTWGGVAVWQMKAIQTQGLPTYTRQNRQPNTNTHTQWTCQVLHVVPQPCANAMPQANLTTQRQHNWHYTWAQTPAPSLQPMGCGQPKVGNWNWPCDFVSPRFCPAPPMAQ